MDTLNVAITGHVDHGKSTFIGRLLYDLGVLPEEKRAKIHPLGDQDRRLELARIMDSFEEERLWGMTIDTSNIVFRHGHRQYTIIDVPGHYELLAKMVTGTSYADAAILIIDVLEGLQRQTKLHCLLLSMMNIHQIIVLINKMDLVGYSQTEFEKIKSSTLSFLDSLNIKSCHIIPTSAASGDNVTTKSMNMQWYSDMTVLAALDSLVMTRPLARELCFPVQDIYEFDGERIIAGWIESGRMSTGQRLLMLPDRTYHTVLEIKKYGRPNLQQAGQGECVGIILRDKDLSAVRRGAVLTDSEDLHVSQKVKGRAFWIAEEPCLTGNRYSICCTTQSVKGTIVNIANRMHISANNELAYSESVDRLTLGEVADIEFELDYPLVFQTGNLTGLANFVMKKDNVSIAGGGHFPD
ncbi:MAG TPA: GTP-binding protein [Candidatus Tripitaka californicus]|uniref:GTP-binding protein n=2 Tax=Candidatus Tripitaka californicus TaxID=3367616 RepID=UPI004025A7C8